MPGLRSILVGGEACPGEIVARWARPGRRMLNTYGPTEATVTAIWCELLPGRPVTIGVPLPTYTVRLIAPEAESVVEVGEGEVGEIALGGPGVARGYVGRPDLTARKFLDTGDGRLYRTGDLGRVVADGAVAGHVEYLGRADDEVKVRGRRVDLGEIESVLLEDPSVGSAVVTPAGEAGELAAYVTAAAEAASGAHGDPRDVTTLSERLVPRWYGLLTARLPVYMVPATVDVLDDLPTQLSGKVDRSALPAASGPRLAVASGPVVVAEGDLEGRIATVWAEAFGVATDALSVTAHFFDDLGGHSLLAASVTSALRARDLGTTPSVRDLYDHPTVRDLAAALAARAGAEPSAVPGAPRHEPRRHSSRRVAAAGVAQTAAIYLLLLLLTTPTGVVYSLRSGEISAGALVALLLAALGTWLALRWLLPPLAVRLLTAGIRPGRHPLWGRTFLRLRAADLVLAISPLPVLAGSPLVAPYLRALGARVGRHVHLASADLSLPAMLDLGDNAAIGYGATLRAWQVEDGWAVVGPITVGPDAVVGTNAVLQPGSSVGDHALLAEQSALGRDVAVGEGEAFAGSPAGPVDEIDPELGEVMAAPRAPGWTLGPLLGSVAGLVGLEAAVLAMVLPSVALVWGAVLGLGVLVGLVAAVLSGPLFVLTACAVVAAGRKLVLPQVPTGVHPVRSGLGVRKWIGDSLLEAHLTYTNAMYATLWTAPWLRLLGARIGRGVEVSTAAHIDPDLLDIGHDSFVADMAAVGAASFANGRMVARPSRIGDRSFVGNAALLPAGADTGRGSLVGVLTVPPKGGVPDHSSWLGSPAIDLPRRETTDSFDEFALVRPTVRQAAHRLAIEFARATLPGSVVAVVLYVYLWLLATLAAATPMAVTLLLAPLLAASCSGAGLLYVVWTKRNVVGTYRPRVEPLWSGFVRRSEFVTGLYEAAAVPAVLGLLVGTPMLPPVLRLFGARVGRRCFVATTYLTEFDLVEVGDDVAVNHGVSLQTHLFEDRVMKMSTVRVGDGATVGTRSIVLYDAAVGDNTLLEPLSLVMKGEALPAGTRWRGVPAEVA